MKNRLVFTFGRFNPPTTGHEKLLNKVAEVAGDDDYLIFPSHTQKKDGNPLDSKTKSDYMKKMFPQHSEKIVYDTSLKTIINVLSKYQGDYMYATVVVGSDRVQQFNILTAKYNGKDYTFRGIDVISAGERDPDADGLTGMSASKMREAAKNKNMLLFYQGIPDTLSQKDKLNLMLDVRKGMGLK